MRWIRLSVAFTLTLGLLAAGRAFTSFSDVQRIISSASIPIPAQLKTADGRQWLDWARTEDKAIRARLQQGDLDSMVNLLLYGTSFTKQPRITMARLTEASRSGVLHARVDDLVAALRDSSDNERVVFVRGLLRSQGIDAVADPKKAGQFVLQNLLRVVEERKRLAEREQVAKPSSPLDRSSLFDTRGLSLDTSIIPDFSIEQTLRELKERGLLREGQVRRVAVVGPGLDTIDKNEESAYDYYPEQTLQPFALYESLVRLKLARPGTLSVSILDISARVMEHVQRARERARQGIAYVVQLPRDAERPWPPELISYWKSFGDQIGTAVAPIHPPAIFRGLDTRAVEIRSDVVLACEPVDLDIILERLNLSAADRFDLIIGTNIFVYYDPFEQALALANAGAMLKPGGLLLSNDRLPTVPHDSMQLAGTTVIPFDAPGVSARQAVGWYQKH